MAQRNQREAGDWRKRVSNLDVLPNTAPVGTTDLWNKFRSRTVKRKRPLLYYFIAAAVLLVAAFTIQFFRPGNNRDKLTVQEAIQPKPALENVIESKDSPFQPPTIKKMKQSQTIVKKHKVQKQVIPGIAPPTDVIVALYPADLGMPDTIATVALVAAAPTKKIKVVHINEINPGDNVAGKENQVLQSYAFRRPSDNIIKINLPSN